MSSILLIDDDTDLLSMLSSGFKKRGYSVCEAAGPTDAMEALRHTPFDYAVLDLNLNGESGMDLLPQLLVECPDLNIVVTTGYASLSTAVEAIKLGASNYLAKPVLIDDIIQAFSGEQAPETNTLGHQDLKSKEWEHIQITLEKNNYNISETAKELGYHRRTLQRKLQKRHY